MTILKEVEELTKLKMLNQLDHPWYRFNPKYANFSYLYTADLDENDRRKWFEEFAKQKYDTIIIPVSLSQSDLIKYLLIDLFHQVETNNFYEIDDSAILPEQDVLFIEFFLKAHIFDRIDQNFQLHPKILLKSLANLKDLDYKDSVNHFIRKFELENSDLLKLYETMTQWRRCKDHKKLLELFLRCFRIDMTKQFKGKQNLIDSIHNLKHSLTELFSDKDKKKSDKEISDMLVQIVYEYAQVRIQEPGEINVSNRAPKTKGVNKRESITLYLLSMIINEELFSFEDKLYLMILLLKPLSVRRYESERLKVYIKKKGGQPPKSFYSGFMGHFFIYLKDFKQIKNRKRWMADFIYNLNEILYYCLKYNCIVPGLDIKPERILTTDNIAKTLQSLKKLLPK